MTKGLLDVRLCRSRERRDALALVLQQLPADQRAPLVESVGGLRGSPLAPLAALAGAWRGKRLTAAAWAQPLAGRAAALWPPQSQDRPSAVVNRRLLDVLNRRVDRAGVTLLQAMLPTAGEPVAADLLASGFRQLATLDYLAWRPSSPLSPPPLIEADGLRFRPVSGLAPGELPRVVERTYESTLDCPEIDGLRDVSDVLEGYRRVGDQSDALWFVLCQHGVPVGVLLLTEFSSSRQMELTYMGLVPRARGRGLGARAVAQAQRLAVDRGATRLVLAVDRRNHPAARIYRRCGFDAWTERTAFVRVRGCRVTR